jgi:transcriptional regulator with XRE-family HTH domain
MPKRKRAAQVIDRGFGFPVRLKNVPMVQIRGTWTPDVDFDALAHEVLRALCLKPARLTGNEVRFIRLHHGLTLARFGKQFGLSHPAVMKWERAGDAPAGMQWGTEKDLRLWLYLELEGKKNARGFVEAYTSLDQEISKRTKGLVDTTKFSCRGRRPVAEAAR